jgi:hypothetical protein
MELLDNAVVAAACRRQLNVLEAAIPEFLNRCALQECLQLRILLTLSA